MIARINYTEPSIDTYRFLFVLSGQRGAGMRITSALFFVLLLGRKKSPLDPSCCPVCGVTLRSADLEAHFVQELERLERISRSFRSTTAANHALSPSGSNLSAPGATSQVQKREQDTRWEVLESNLIFM